jgi:hypothetical protein
VFVLALAIAAAQAAPLAACTCPVTCATDFLPKTSRPHLPCCDDESSNEAEFPPCGSCLHAVPITSAIEPAALSIAPDALSVESPPAARMELPERSPLHATPEWKTDQARASPLYLRFSVLLI